MIFNILAVGVMGTAMALSPMQPRYIVDNQNDTITFSAEELNNKTYQYLAEQANQIQEQDISDTGISYNNVTYTFKEFDSNDYIDYENGDLVIRFMINETDTNYGKWQYIDDAEGEYLDFEYSLTITKATWFIANIEEPPSLTLSKYDLNNKKYTYLAEQINNEQDFSNFQNATITYNGKTYTYDELATGDTLSYNQEETNIRLILDNTDNNYGKWIYHNSALDEDQPFTASMTINNAQWFIDNINAPLDSGDMMTAITSGLPLMANLAQAFLNGFTSIFWNSTTNTLTTFSNFALIMLSVAIVFACIKLVLNLVRSNTGV